MELSFSGAVWNCIYHIGVLKYLQESKPDSLKTGRFLGASSGCLTALAAACDIPWTVARDIYLRAADETRQSRLGSWFRMTQVQRKGLEKLLANKPNAYRQASGKLFVSVTLIPPVQNVLISQFENNRALFDTLLGSSFIPGYSTKVIVRGRKMYVDGGITNNRPQLSQETITICPVSPDATICPSQPYPSLSGFRPHDEIDTQRMFECGYEDAKTYFRKNHSQSTDYAAETA